MADTKSNLWQKLQKVQTQIKVYKDQRVEYGKTKYSYRSLEQILAELKPLLETNGIYISQSDDIELIGNSYFVKATTKAYDIETGETITNTAYAQIDYATGMNESQKTGSASSYARKYGICGLFGIEGEQDPDSQEPPQQPQRQKSTKQKEKTVDNSQLETMFKILDTPEKLQAFKELINSKGYENSEDILAKDWTAINKEVNQKLIELEQKDARDKAPF